MHLKYKNKFKSRMICCRSLPPPYIPVWWWMNDIPDVSEKCFVPDKDTKMHNTLDRPISARIFHLSKRKEWMRHKRNPKNASVYRSGLAEIQIRRWLTSHIVSVFLYWIHITHVTFSLIAWWFKDQRMYLIVWRYLQVWRQNQLKYTYFFQSQLFRDFFLFTSPHTKSLCFWD